MSRLALLSLTVLLFAGCFSLDSFLFDQTRVNEYLRPEDMEEDWHVRFIIPDSLIELVTLASSDGNTIYGFFVQPAPDTARAFENSVTVLYSHGNGDNINRYWGRVELLWEMGYRVFIYDYQGFGRSEGEPSGPALYADARAALAYCRAREDVTDSLLVHYGWSLGSFMACYLATDISRDTISYLGLILENPMASVSAVTREGALFDIPGSFLVEADFDNEERIRRVGRPVLMVRGDLDDTAVPERNGDVLRDIALRWHVDLTEEIVAGGGHSDIPEVMGYDEYARLVRAFITSCATGQ